MSPSQRPGDSRAPLPGPPVEAEALPLQKPTTAVYLTGGIAVLAVVGLLAYAFSGDDTAAQKEKGAEAQRAAAASTGLSASDLKEQQAHLRRTQLALEAVREEPAVAPQVAPAPPTEKTEPAPDDTSPRTASSSGSKKPAPSKKPAAGSKKKLDGLDSLGSDITSALK